MSSETGNLTVLDKGSIKTASRVLSRAFQESPINVYAYPDAGVRSKKLPSAFESVLRYGMKYGRVYTTSDRLEGVAVWMQPESMKMNVQRLWQAGALWSAMRIGISASVRMLRINMYIEKKHGELATFDHWYLMLVGVDPEYQGNGYGGRLIKSMLCKAAEAGLPCYLETETESNVRLYQHFGFEVIDEFIVPGTPVKIWVMLRRQPA
jgi:GNAT superfamily N-acetyltransferase